MWKKNIGWYVSLSIMAIPGLIWLSMMPLSDRFSSLTTILTSLGQLAGLTGMTMFAVTLILISRSKWLEKMFAGLNTMYDYHHVFGAISFALLLLHPIFLAIKYWLFSPYAAALFLLPSENWGINLGIFGLLIMIASIVLTFFGKLLYEHWRFSHKFLGLAFLLGGIHTFLAPTDVSRSVFLKIYLLILCFAALFIYIYRALLQRWLVPKYEYQVVDITKFGPDIIEITLAQETKNISFFPGQFVFAEFNQGKISSEIHPFSISSDAGQENIKLAIKYLGDYSEGLSKLKVGAMAKLEGPFGVFSYIYAKHKQQIWIGGGVGITPILSMARSLSTNSDFKIVIYYCLKDEAEAVFLKELKKIEKNNPAITILTNYSVTQGHLTAKKLQKNQTTKLEETDVFICGPKDMMSDLKRQLINSQIPEEQIHTEEFAMH